MTNPFHAAARKIEKMDRRSATAKRIRCEGRIVAALVAAGLARGYTVSVSDGEEFTINRSTDAAAILAATFSTDMDTLRFREADGTSVGWFDLVYGNDGYDVISDHSANKGSEELMADIQPVIDREEARPAFA